MTDENIIHQLVSIIEDPKGYCERHSIEPGELSRKLLAAASAVFGCLF